MAGLTPLGDTWNDIKTGIQEGKSGVTYMDEWDRYEHIHTRLGAPLPSFSLPEHYTRKRTRSMGKLAKMATLATEHALLDAGLHGDPILQSGRTGVAYGSSSGSSEHMLPFGQMYETGKLKGITSTSYLKMMPHTCAANIGLFFGLKGRVLPTNTACTSGSLAIGYAYEAIKYGRQDVMLAGGADALSMFEVVVFDLVYATSRQNDNPDNSPRPFDQSRDGLVLGEGACTLVLESLEHAQARGATIYAELVGFGTNSDGHHVVQPAAETMQQAMQLSLDDAQLDASQIAYVNAHATATTQGDIIESQATHSMFGEIPVSSFKGYFGHTLGASGAIEAWLGIQMMREGWFAPTRRLQDIDERCAALDYIQAQPRSIQAPYWMSNNFAFVGINTSLIFAPWQT
jgi:3-oxoacyl-[acyl-carrier-protein] synthase II